MDAQRHSMEDLIVEHLIEHGPEGMLAVFTAAYNMGMKVERERFIGAAPSQTATSPNASTLRRGRPRSVFPRPPATATRRSTRRRSSAAVAANRRSWPLRPRCISRASRPATSRTCWGCPSRSRKRRSTGANSSKASSPAACAGWSTSSRATMPGGASRRSLAALPLPSAAQRLQPGSHSPNQEADRGRAAGGVGRAGGRTRTGHPRRAGRGVPAQASEIRRLARAQCARGVRRLQPPRSPSPEDADHKRHRKADPAGAEATNKEDQSLPRRRLAHAPRRKPPCRDRR